MKRLAGLVVGALLVAQPAAAQSGCTVELSDGSVDVGQPVEIDSGGFDAGSPVVVMAGGWEVAGGTAVSDGALTATYEFDSPGEYPIRVFGLVGGSVCRSEAVDLVVVGEGDPVPSMELPADFIPAALASRSIPETGQITYLEVEIVEIPQPPGVPGQQVEATTTEPTSAAAPEDTTDGAGPSVLLPGAVALLAAGVFGLGSGWLVARRRS